MRLGGEAEMCVWFGVVIWIVAMVGCGAEGEESGVKATIFGLQRGMSVQEVKKVGLGKIKPHEKEPNIYFIPEPSKPSDASTIIVEIPDQGLLRITVMWGFFDDNSYGDDLKEKFYNLRDILVEKYGEGVLERGYGREAIWTEPKYWVRALKENEVWLAWEWTPGNAKKSASDLEKIYLKAMIVGDKYPAIALNYCFEGFKEYDDSLWSSSDNEF